MDGLYTRTINGPELCHSALAEACEKEIVERILRGEKEEWDAFTESCDGYELACAVRDCLKDRSDADLAMGSLSLGLAPLATEYAKGYAYYRAEKGELEDLGQELGLIEQ